MPMPRRIKNNIGVNSLLLLFRDQIQRLLSCPAIASHNNVCHSPHPIQEKYQVPPGSIAARPPPAVHDLDRLIGKSVPRVQMVALLLTVEIRDRQNYSL